MALNVEGVIDRCMCGEKSLRRTGGLEALHPSFSLPYREMRILGPIVDPTVLAVDRDEDFIEMPMRISTRVRASEFSGIGQAKLKRPAADRFIRDIDAALGQHILDIAQAQTKAKVQPDRLLDHSGREAMATIRRTAHRTLIAYGIN